MDLVRKKRITILVIAFVVIIGMLIVPTTESFAAADSGTRVAPKKVSGLTAVRKSYNKIKVNWKTDKKADGYYVYRQSAGHAKKLVKKIKNENRSEYTDTVTPGVTYRYTVKAFNKVKVTVEKKVRVKVQVPVQDEPAADTEGQTDSNLKAAADENTTGAAENKEGDATAKAAPEKTETKTVVKTVTKVKTRIVKGKKATVKGKTYIDVPVKFKAATASNGIKLSWKKIRYASGYKVYRYIPAKGKYVCVKTLKGASKTSYINKSTKIKKQFSYKVSAVKKIKGKTYASKTTASKMGKTVKTRSSYYDPDTSLDVLAKAATRIGCAYVGGAAGPRKFDCSGLVYWSLKNTKDNIVKPARSSCSGMYASTFYKYNIGTDTSKLRRGDIVLFGHGHSFHHTGIYAGNGMIVHAACPGKGVRRDPIRWFGHVGAIIRLP